MAVVSGESHLLAPRADIGEGHSVKLHLGSGQKYREGWTNVDWTRVYRTDVQANFMGPEFWASLGENSVDALLFEHGPEHIPHTMRHTEKDGLIWFMEEVYRVCKDGATLEIAFPHYQGSWAYGDPTHCRFVQAMTLAYFDRARAGKDMPDYGLACDFETVSSNMAALGGETKDSPEFRARIHREWNHVYEERVILRCHKPMRVLLPVVG